MGPSDNEYDQAVRKIAAWAALGIPADDITKALALHRFTGWTEAAVCAIIAGKNN